MDERATAIAHLLLRVGVLDPDDPDHQQVRQDLIADSSLHASVREKLAAVGWRLEQFLGYWGVRLDRGVEAAAIGLPRGGDLQAHHLRMLIWLWVQLVYRQIEAARREEEPEALPGRRQRALDLGDGSDSKDDVPSIAFDEVMGEFGQQYNEKSVKGMLSVLRKHRFVRQDGATGPVRPGPALFVLVDPLRMEEHVVGLARRGASPLATAGSGGPREAD
jgi:hypothetical protein